jgi:hypothetical protein
MGLMIYQIGDLPLFFNLRNFDSGEVSLDANREWKAPTTEFTQTSGEHLFSDLGRPLSESQKLELKGMFVCDEDQISAQALFNRLLSMGGIPLTPVIGFHYEECEHVPEGSCCSACNTTLDWIVNYGIITKLPQDSSYHSSKKPWSASTFPVSISMVLGTKWKALNSWEWEYRKDKIVNPLSPTLRSGSISNTFILPNRLSELHRKGYFFRWGVTLSKYDPSYWGLKYTNGRMGGIGSDYVSIGEHSFNSDPERWSASPNSVYSFTNFSNLTGTITLRVTRNYNYFSQSNLVDESTLDLAQLNTDLINGGLGGLLTTDQIVTGYASPFPGFVIRGGEILSGVRPRWSYPGAYPGETGRGYNKIEYLSDDLNYEAAYLHDFGLY